MKARTESFRSVIFQNCPINWGKMNRAKWFKTDVFDAHNCSYMHLVVKGITKWALHSVILSCSSLCEAIHRHGRVQTPISAHSRIAWIWWVHLHCAWLLRVSDNEWNFISDRDFTVSFSEVSRALDQSPTKLNCMVKMQQEKRISRLSSATSRLLHIWWQSEWTSPQN